MSGDAKLIRGERLVAMLLWERGYLSDQDLPESAGGHQQTRVAAWEEGSDYKGTGQAGLGAKGTMCRPYGA
jgi:hypothetical protein